MIGYKFIRPSLHIRLLQTHKRAHWLKTKFVMDEVRYLKISEQMLLINSLILLK